MSIKHPNCLHEDATLNLHLLDVAILREFLGHLCKKRDKHGDYLDPIVYHAFLHVSEYKSAVKDYYSNMVVKFSADILLMFEQFFEGKKSCEAEARWNSVHRRRQTANVVQGVQISSYERCTGDNGSKFGGILPSISIIMQESYCQMCLYRRVNVRSCFVGK